MLAQTNSNISFTLRTSVLQSFLSFLSASPEGCLLIAEGLHDLWLGPWSVPQPAASFICELVYVHFINNKGMQALLIQLYTEQGSAIYVLYPFFLSLPSLFSSSLTVNSPKRK